MEIYMKEIYTHSGTTEHTARTIAYNQKAIYEKLLHYNPETGKDLENGAEWSGLWITCMSGKKDNVRTEKNNYAHLKVICYSKFPNGAINDSLTYHVYVTTEAYIRNNAVKERTYHPYISMSLINCSGSCHFLFINKYKCLDIVPKEAITRTNSKISYYQNKNKCYIFDYEIKHDESNIFFFTPNTFNAPYFPYMSDLQQVTYNKYRARKSLKVETEKATKYFKSIPELCSYLESHNIIKINVSALKNRLNRNNNDIIVKTSKGNMHITRESNEKGKKNE